MYGTPERFYSTDQIIRHSSSYTHFFDADSKRFFNSRIGQNAYPTNNPFVTLFTTSEKYENRYSGHSEPRKYSIRSYDCRDHSIDTIGEFQQYKTGTQANKEAKRLATEWEFNQEDMHEYALLLNTEYDSTKRHSIYRNDRGFAMYDIGAVNNFVILREETEG